MTPERGMNWILGLGFVAMFAFSQVVFHQRDEARKANKAHVEVSDALITVSCQEPRPNGQ